MLYQLYQPSQRQSGQVGISLLTPPTSCLLSLPLSLVEFSHYIHWEKQSEWHRGETKKRKRRSFTKSPKLINCSNNLFPRISYSFPIGPNFQLLPFFLLLLRAHLEEEDTASIWRTRFTENMGKRPRLNTSSIKKVTIWRSQMGVPDVPNGPGSQQAQ